MPPPRVLVLFEPGASGAAALHAGAELARDGDGDGELTVVTLAPQDVSPHCCGPGPGEINCHVRELAAGELAQARNLLGDASATYRVLVGDRDPPLTAWAAGLGFGVIVLPSRRSGPAGHRLARALRRVTGAEVRVVGGRAGARRPAVTRSPT
jgi:hypothetical protein